MTASAGARFTFTRLLVADVAASLAFYRDVLGLGVGFVDDSGHYADLDTGAGTLALFTGAVMAAALGPPAPPSPDRVALCFAVADVDAAAAAVIAAGVPLVTPPHDRPDWGLRVAHLRDPDGTLIELNAPLRA